MQKDSTANLHSDKIKKKCIFICKVAVPKRHPVRTHTYTAPLAPAYHWNAIHTSFCPQHTHNIAALLHHFKHALSHNETALLKQRLLTNSILTLYLTASLHLQKLTPEAHTIVHNECYKKLYNVQLSIYVCVCMCVWVYIYIYIYIHTHTHTHTHTHIHTYIHTYIHTQTHTQSTVHFLVIYG